MLCQPKSFYDEKHKVAIGYKKHAQSAVYNGHMPVTTNHTPTVIHDSKDTRELAEITRKRMLLKMSKGPLHVDTLIANDVSKVHDESKLISKLEREYLNLQLKYQHLQESFDNKKSQASQEAPDFRSFFKIKNLEHQIQEKDNVIRHLKDRVANVNDRSRVPYNAIDVTALVEQNDCYRVELEKVKQHYKELYDSIKSARVHTSEKTSTMLNEIESLKAQLRSKEPCFTSDYVKPKVLAPGMYAIDVKPIPHPLKNNRGAHLNYVKHLKESVETVREIVEEARVVKPLDSSLNYACQYTKLSQELLECVIGTCPKSFNERDNKAPSTPVTRKKQVTFSDAPGTSSSNTQKHEVHQKVWKLRGKPLLMLVSNGDPRKKGRLGKLNCGYQWRPTGKKFALGELCPLTKLSVVQIILRYLDSSCSKLDLEEEMNGSCTHQFRTRAYNDVWTKQFKPRSSSNDVDHTCSSLGLHCQKTFDQISSNLVSKMSQRRLLASLQAPFLKEKKGVRFSALYLQQKRNLLVLDHSHQQVSVVKWINVDQLKLQMNPIFRISVDIFVRALTTSANVPSIYIQLFWNTLTHDAKTGVYSFQVDEHWLTLSADLLRKALNVTPADSAHPFESPPAGKTDITFTRRRVPSNWLMKMKFNRLLNLIWMIMSTIYNKTSHKYYEGVGIFHQKSVPRTPQQNGVVERRNRTLVEAARTMLIFSKAPMFLWAEAVATACYTQNRSLIHTRHNKTPYELVHDKKPDLTFLRVFGALCYPTNDSEDLGKFQAKADIGIFVGYAPSRKGYRIYNKRTRRLMETIHVTFDEMHQTMAPVRISSGPEPIMMTPGQLNSGLAPSPVPATTYIPPTDKDLEILFQPMFDEYFDQSTDSEPVPTATVVNAPIVSTNTSVSTTIAQDAPSTSHSLSSSQVHPPVFPQGVAAGPTIEDTSITQADLHPSVNPVAGEPSSAQSTSGDVSLAEPNQVNQPPDHLRKWTKDHPLDNIVGNPSRPVSTRKQLASDALWCCYHTVLSKVEPKNFKMAVNEDSWFKAMQDEIHEFDRLKCNRVLERQKKLRNQIFRALTASADVPSSVTETTDTTSTLQPPRPPL
ncbi:putative ribonuclease H-like domain-containing protein [Tanacetum coccineum]